MSRLILCFSFLFFVFAGVNLNATIYYVDAAKDDDTGNGQSWDNAKKTLQAALDLAVNTGDQVWVKAGIHYPTEEVGGEGDRYRTFQMKNGVEIYGGFAENAEEWEDRDFESNVTVLSGDIGTVGDNSDNCYHIFYHPFGLNLNSSAVLDGFTITGGNANGTDPHNLGGGMHNYYSSPTIRNCKIEYNNASSNGGGLFNFQSSPEFTDCNISDNIATRYGGGILNVLSSPEFTDCNISNNEATIDGGGMYNDNSESTLTDCTISNNSANNGGGFYNYDRSSTFTDCTISYNNADQDGGGMYNYKSESTLTNCTISYNSATRDGGGM
jgi:hypothetical protein